MLGELDSPSPGEEDSSVLSRSSCRKVKTMNTGALSHRLDKQRLPSPGIKGEEATGRRLACFGRRGQKKRTKVITLNLEFLFSSDKVEYLFLFFFFSFVWLGLA